MMRFVVFSFTTDMTKLSGQFRNTQWDPILIISQIVALQSVYYVMLGLWVASMNLLVGTSRSLDHLFKYQVGFIKADYCFCSQSMDPMYSW